MSLILDALRRAERPATGEKSASTLLGTRRAAAWKPLAGAAGLGLLVGFALFGRTSSGRFAATAVAPEARPPSEHAGGASPWSPERTVFAGAIGSARRRENGANGPRTSPGLDALAPSNRQGPAVPVPSSAFGLTAGTPPATPDVSLVLQGISARDGLPIAMIGGRLVREGDMIGRVRVLKIGAETVDILHGDGTRGSLGFPELAAEPPASPTPPTLVSSASLVVPTPPAAPR